MRQLVTGLWFISLVAVAAPASTQEFGFERQPPRFLLADAEGTVPLDVERTPLLMQRLALDLKGVSLREALETLTSQSGLRLVYNDDVIPIDAPVHLRADDITVAAALTDILLGSGIDVVFRRNGRAALVRRTPHPALQTGTIVGTVIGARAEGEALEPVARAQVSVEGTGLGTLTNNEGRFQINNVPAGRQSVTVTSVGWRRTTQSVDVAEDETVTLDFTLVVSPTALDEIVVTVTGEQRVRELGHATARINAESVVREAPVSSVSELLNARVPGLQVFTASGAVGGEVSLRARSTSTRYLSNDPIVIVDGFRYTSSSSTIGDDRVEGTSRLNDLNPNDIESIEVVKGPSATTLYGTDASNGVIVVTTKRGRAGPARWNAYVRAGLTEVPDYRHPDAYWGWGSASSSCTLRLTLLGSCAQDSVSVIPNPLNDSELTIFGREPHYEYGASVSGGTERLQYHFSTGLENATGPVRLPPTMAAELRGLHGGSLPSETLRPNSQNKLNVRTNVAARLSETAELRVSAGYTQSDTRQVMISGGPYTSNRTTPDAPYGDASFAPVGSFARSSTERVNRFTGGAVATWTAAPWLQTRATVGVDLMSGQRYSLEPRGVWEGHPGSVRDNRNRSLVTTVELGATANHTIGRISSRTSVGAQYVRNFSDLLTLQGNELIPGGASVTDAAALFSNHFYDETITLGTYIEQVLGLNNRLFLTGALRADGASTFGHDYDAVFYPKVGLSWVASEEPFLPRLPGLDELRLRYAFGSSGQQPGSSMGRMDFFSTQGFVEGEVQNTVRLSALGNPDLRPEQVREHEFGLDAVALDGRLQLDLTWNRRGTIDQITPSTLPAGFGSHWTNLGLVTGRGFEAELAAQLFHTRIASLDVMVSYATNSDKLEDLGGRFPEYSVNGSFVEGFPLGARFMRPLLDYEDANGDGIIGTDEVVLGDTAVYVGRGTPGRTQTLTATLGLAEQRVRVSALIERRSEFAVVDGLSQGGRALGRAGVDPTAPLADQARVVASYAGGPPDQSVLTAYKFLADGDFTRLRELSLVVDMPEGWVRAARLERATLNLSGRNLALWTKFSGPDPESAGMGSLGRGLTDANRIPQARTWVIRFDVGF